MAINSFSNGNFINSLQAAGKNKIINGDFGIWQRGTSFSGLVDQAYFADRFIAEWFANGATNVFSRQSFTVGSAPVSGYESSYFARCAVTSGAAGTVIGATQKIEDVRTFAGQTVTVSFWAKADSARAMTLYVVQNFGSGGSTSVSSTTSIGNNTTAWVRYTITAAIPSISGKTVGTSSFLSIGIIYNGASSALNSAVLDLWGVQVELGSTATTFTTASGGSPQGELAMCQRYYFRVTSGSTGYIDFGSGTGSADNFYPDIVMPVNMRVTPTSIDTSAMATFQWYNALGGGNTPTTITLSDSSPNLCKLAVNKTAGFTSGRPYAFGQNNTTAYLGFSSEL